MQSVFTMSRRQLEKVVKTFGYTEAEVKAWPRRDLQECIFYNTDQPDPDWYGPVYSES